MGCHVAKNKIYDNIFKIWASFVHKVTKKNNSCSDDSVDSLALYQNVILQGIVIVKSFGGPKWTKFIEVIFN